MRVAGFTLNTDYVTRWAAISVAIVSAITAAVWMKKQLKEPS